VLQNNKITITAEHITVFIDRPGTENGKANGKNLRL
jgi:lipopolysaccharide export system protein LptA